MLKMIGPKAKTRKMEKPGKPRALIHPWIHREILEVLELGHEFNFPDCYAVK
jgi:hypothetical protein